MYVLISGAVFASQDLLLRQHGMIPNIAVGYADPALSLLTAKISAGYTDSGKELNNNVSPARTRLY